MRSTLFLSAIAGTALAQHVHYTPHSVAVQVEKMIAENPWLNETTPADKHANVARQSCSYWMESIQHQGRAAFNSNPNGYQVFRNVKDFGARGDGSTDDTAAINAAISAGNRCDFGSCQSSTTSPAVVYFPPGTYVLSSSIRQQYYTQLIGNPNCRPVLRPQPGFNGGYGGAVIDPDVGRSYGSTNIFFRQVRNFVVDMTGVPATLGLSGIRWTTAQATSLQNMEFRMSTSTNNNQQSGVTVEDGSGGFMTDLTFNGGWRGGNWGNQQFTTRNLVFNNVQTAIYQNWDWGWTYSGITINNCQIGIDMSSNNNLDQAVGSVVLIDSSISDTPLAVKTIHDGGSRPRTAGSLVLENVAIRNVAVVVSGYGGQTLLAGTSGSTTIAGWAQGNKYNPNGPQSIQGPQNLAGRPGSLLSGGKYYTRSKPQYENLPTSSFISARSSGARGDGNTDDTNALQNAINTAQQQGKILYLDHGDYIVTNTINIPPGSRIVGETYSVILSAGGYFNDMNNPKPVVKIGNAGQSGNIEWSDTIVSTRGAQAGAILIQFNLASASNAPSGLWDVHTRIGGFAGSQLQNECATNAPQPNSRCYAAYMSMHVSKPSSGLYLENNWFWVADHDIEASNLGQITVWAGRGLLIESSTGNVWLWGTSVEHHTLYQYELVNTHNFFAGYIQTETPYYQPSPPAPGPWTYSATFSDPQFPQAVTGGTPSADAWGLRIVSSRDIFIYGAGLYSFFTSYSADCAPNVCQLSLFSLEGNSGNVNIYELINVGTQYLINNHGTLTGNRNDNLAGFSTNIAIFQSG